ncbi:MAG TPA: ORF6N domain-containing protein [Blastocatellia bacterium]|nr:ORF6N domain-containing protein [Blastocatellia bacterium]
MPRKKSPSSQLQVVVQFETVERKIHLIRGQRVMLDSDLAELYEVETFNLNKAVKRNIERFPEDFMFQLTREEADSLRFQSGISNEGRGGRRYLPYVFTEQGVAMLSSVLRSERAVQVNIAIMRAFVKLRELMNTHAELAQKIEAMERQYGAHDKQIGMIFELIKRLLRPPDSGPLPPRKPIGFRPQKKQ